MLSLIGERGYISGETIGFIYMRKQIQDAKQL
jgi:hypothetical protein